jgi:hypothetical protein
MICELCKKDHYGTYGSGRFCSRPCATKFSSRLKRVEINKNLSIKMKGWKFILGGKIRLCEYGCGQEAKYQLKNNKWCCESSPNKCPKVRKLNSTGVKKSHKDDKFNYSYFSENAKKYSDIRITKLRKLQDSLTWDELTYASKRRRLLREQNNKCLICNISEWNNKSLVLHYDHIDGNNKNESRENVRFICPNCHSQTDTYTGKNLKNDKRYKHGKVVQDLTLIEALKNTENIHQALIKVGMVPKGGNYIRCKNLLKNTS